MTDEQVRLLKECQRIFVLGYTYNRAKGNDADQFEDVTSIMQRIDKVLDIEETRGRRDE
jgi:hypothetical protein